MIWNKSSFLQDFSTFNSLLSKYDVPVDTSSLYRLEGKLESLEYINYEINDVIFHLEQRISGSFPVNVDLYEITFDLVFKTNNNLDLNLNDPFKDCGDYSLQLYIKGTDIDKSEDFYNCWHLDRHIDGGDNPKVVHPYYHFQNGGNKLEEIGIDGNALFTGAPRIPHPPMDIFLAFHFIVCNYFNCNSFPFVNELFEDYDYNEIIKRAQERMWKPYYNSFNNSNHLDYSIEKITPLYTVH